MRSCRSLVFDDQCCSAPEILQMPQLTRLGLACTLNPIIETPRVIHKLPHLKDLALTDCHDGGQGLERISLTGVAALTRLIIPGNTTVGSCLPGYVRLSPSTRAPLLANHCQTCFETHNPTCLQNLQEFCYSSEHCACGVIIHAVCGYNPA